MLSRLLVISLQRAVSPINLNEPRSILTLLKSQIKREILHPSRSALHDPCSHPRPIYSVLGEKKQSETRQAHASREGPARKAGTHLVLSGLPERSLRRVICLTAVDTRRDVRASTERTVCGDGHPHDAYICRF